MENKPNVMEIFVKRARYNKYPFDLSVKLHNKDWEKNNNKSTPSHPLSPLQWIYLSKNCFKSLKYENQILDENVIIACLKKKIIMNMTRARQVPQIHQVYTSRITACYHFKSS